MSAYPIKSPKKLIEVALPLDAINKAAAREKSIRHGHPSTLHLWWARRPLAAARAVIFAQLVNDPGYQQGGGFRYGKNKKEAAVERKRLFKILEDLVLWENTNNEAVLEAARAEIRRSWREVCELNKDHPQAAELFNPDKMPGLHDPFAGGGTIPLEAQRLGLEAFASDLNPVAVLINKAMIEIPTKFAGRPPVHPEARKAAGLRAWKGAEGLAEDVRRYGAWMREEAEKRIGDLYPNVTITPEMAKERPDLKGLVGRELTVIAWLWARTVKSPNPAFSHVSVPLVSSFLLSRKEGLEYWIEPIITADTYRFEVRQGKPPDSAGEGTKAPGRGAAFHCLLSSAPISGEHIKKEGQNNRIGARLLAVVAEGDRGRVYLSPTAAHEATATAAMPTWRPELEFAHNSRHLTPWAYGLSTFGSLFTARQLVALNTLCDLVHEARQSARVHAVEAGLDEGDLGYDQGGTGARAYGEAISTYLAFATDKVAEGSTSLCTWSPLPTKLHVVSTFGRQALQITWDFAEANIFADSSGNVSRMCELVANTLVRQVPQDALSAQASQANALGFGENAPYRIVSSDPPYYDNVPYADLADFFYVWLRRSLREVYPTLFATMAVPKAEELVADAFRLGSKEKAESFFLDGMSVAMRRVAEKAHPAAPVTIYYAFKQSPLCQRA